MAQKVGSGYEGIYLDLAGRLADFDLAGNAPHLGLRVTSRGEVAVRFFARDYLVDGRGVRPLDGGPVGVNHLSLVAHYAMSPGRGEPEGRFLPLGRMTGLVEGRDTFARDGLERPLVREFGGDLPALSAAALRLEGEPLPGDPSGALAWLFRPFPKVPLKLLHHPADEEFPAEFRLLFDADATRFMEFEALGFLCGVFLAEMCSRA